MKNKPHSSKFKKLIYSVVAAIPRGSVMTYGEVARKAGFPNAARAVGSLMANNYDPSIPCHRVIRSDGTVGDYNRGGPGKKIELLLQERASLA